MRSIPLAAIAIPILTSGLMTQVQAQVRTPSARDVVVEIKLSPAQQTLLPSFRASPAGNRASATATFESFNSQQLDRQLQHYLTYVEQFGTPDVLIVGSSRALQGVDPLVLQQSLEQQGLRGIKIFNFGINGATAQVVHWLLSALLPPDHLPQLILWADGSRAFNSGRVDQTFSKIVASKGNQQLSSGTRLSPKVTSGLKLGQVCIDLLPVQLPIKSKSQVQPGLDGQWQRTGLPERSPANYCHQPIKVLVRQASTGIAQPPSVPLEALGFQVVDTQFNPSQYFQRYPRVAGSFDADYRDFNLTGVQTRALRKVAQLATARKIPLLVVNLPLTMTYLDGTRTFYESQFRSQMVEFARTQGFTFTDLSRYPKLAQNRNFADPSHLNRFGAASVSTHLGQELGRIWTTSISQRQPSGDQRRSAMPNSPCLHPCLYFPQLLAE